MTAEVVIEGRRHYPVVGFGGYMIAFDGGDDFLLTDFGFLPQYEFSIQFWIQQHKIRPDQTILTWWTDQKGREFEIADTSNIYFYHLNNRTAKTGVSIDDGKWHHMSFSWRLVCRDNVRIPGGSYCVENLVTRYCLIDRDCLHVEIVTFVDAEERARSYLPPFLPSSSGQMIWGQRMVKPLKTDEVKLREDFFAQTTLRQFNTTANIYEPYTDNQLQLMFNRLRSGYFGEDDLLTGSMSKQAEKGTFSEDEPWRSPQSKYCALQGGGGFDPWNALSANIDEIRIYSYFRNSWDINLDIDRVINADALYTFSNPEVNQSLLLYYTFDLYGNDFKLFAKDDPRNIPLTIRDEASYPPGSFFRSDARLGDANFAWAPMQVPSTAPLFGSRTVQLIVPDSTQSIPIDLIDLAFDDDTPQSDLYSRIDVAPEFGELYAGADDCDTIFDVFPNLFEEVFQQPACKGSIIGIRILGGLGQFTSNCAVGMQLTASDGFGGGSLATITSIGSGGVITSIEMESFGKNYDWTLANPTSLVVDSAACLCGGNPGNVAGNMDPCLEVLIKPGFADTSGALFSGFSYPLAGDPVADRVLCSGGICPATKPRPCLEACHRSVGWRSDLLVQTATFNKDVVGPWVEYEQDGFSETYWSNSRHTVWYVPKNLRRADHYVQDDTGQFLLQDTIKDEFLVRKFDSFPTQPFIVPATPHPFVHLWVQVLWEKVAMALNSSVAWEESSEVLIHLQVLDFDRGSSSHNAPFSVYVDRPTEGQLFQAVRISRDDPNFERDCVCPSFPRFPDLLRTPETSYYPSGTKLPGARPCKVEDLGQFCMKIGDPIVDDDELVTSYYDTRVLPGFQHARDGFFVIYAMGVGKNGLANFKWRLKHPQGQVHEAKVDIEIRSINNRPVALHTSATTQEDQQVIIKLNASDPDDVERPTLYVTHFPKHGQLYQCDASSPDDACTIGEKVSDLNETILQTATLTVDYHGAIDDEITPVFRAVTTKDGELQIIQNSPNTTTVLTRGYGYSSYNFNPDEPNNFRKMCGGRGTVAVDVLLEQPIYYTDFEIFYPIRYDTPFRLLARRLKNYPIITYDYNVDRQTGVLEDILTSSAEVSQQGIELTEDDNQRIYFNDEGELRAERSFASERIFCYEGGVDQQKLVRCQQRWDGTKYVKGERRRVVDESRIRWFEMYRGLPHQAMAAEGRVSPIVTDSRILAQEFRLEACGQEGRVFGEDSPNFMELLNDIRITGTFTRRPQGFVADASYRLVYIPFHNYVGKDEFWYVAIDSAGGAKRSPAMFSLQQHRSPRAHVGIEVFARPDVPQGTNAVISAVAGVNASWEIDLRGSHPGSDGSSPVTTFQIEVTEMPSRGDLAVGSGAALAQNVLTTFSGTVRYGASEGKCGMQYTSFRYRLKNANAGDDIFSPIHSVTIQLRCRIGFRCNEADQLCEPCPTGTYGVESQWSPNSCVSCPAGHFQDSVGATKCEACSPGMYNPRPRSSRCYLCPEGTKNALAGQSHCIACPGGQYYPFKGSVECINCGPTQYTESEGQYRCKECPLNTRAVSELATAVEFCECTAGSYDVLGRTGRECVACPHGAYCHGRSLLPVPRTGYWTSQELWTGDNFDSDLNRTVSGKAFFVPCSFRHIRGACLGYPDVDVQEQEERCLYKDHEVVLGPTRLSTLTSEGKDITIVPCTLQPPEVESIPGLRSWVRKQEYATNSYCAEGYTGIICSRCAPRFFRALSGACDHCAVFYRIPFINLIFWGFIVGLNLLFWLFMFMSTAHRARSMYIFISHMQLAAILGRLSVPWPFIAQGPLNRFALFNLDLDGMEWNCMGINWQDYSARWFIELLIPIVIVGATYLYFVYQVYYAKAAVIAFGNSRDRYARQSRSRAKSRGSIVVPGASNRPKTEATMDADRASVTTRSTEELLSDGDASDNGSDESNHSNNSAATAATAATGGESRREPSRHGKGTQNMEKPDRDVLVTLSPKDIRKLRDSGYWLTAMNINLLFVMAARIILVPWSCTSATPGLTYLNADPNMSCGTDKHFNMKILSLLSGFFWFVVFPCAMVYILRKAWYNELVMDRMFKRQFGWMFEHYHPKYVWWETTVVLRKAVVVSIASLFSDNGYMQLMLLLIFLSLHLILTFYCMPHIHRRHNIIELFLQGGYLLLVCYALTNLVSIHGLKIINTVHGAENTNERVGILQPQPGMEEIADRLINNSFIVNVCFLAIIGLGLLATVFMLLYDIYEIKPQAPYWAPYLYNTIFGTPLYTWEQVISQFMAVVDTFLIRVRERQRLKPPDRPSSRWAHRIAVRDDQPSANAFQAEKTVEEMLHAVVAATQEQEWARDKVSVMNYIESLDRRIFASEMYNSKAANLPALERECNLAKKRLLLFMHDEVGDVFKSLYDQTGRNEQALWDIQEIERLTTHRRVMSIAQKEHGKQLEEQIREQERRVGDVGKWKEDYQKAKKRCEDLERDVKQARDAVLLYHLESSASSEDEKDLDDLLEQRITEYIDNKTAQDLCNEGKMNPMPKF